MAGAGFRLSTLGSTVEVSEIESLSDGNIIIGDGSGAPTTRAAFASSTGALTTFLAPSGGTVTADTPFFSATQTWNAGAVTFVGAKITITDTASASASLPLQILGGAAGATTLFSVRKDGSVFPSGSVEVADDKYFLWSARSLIGSPANGQLNISNRADSAGVGLDFATDSMLKIRNRAQLADASITCLGITDSGAAITSGSGTGLTVNETASVRTVIHKVTVTFAALAAAALTADKTIATLPAKTRLVGIVADTTATYTGGGVTAASIIVGTTVGGAELVATHDVFTATITRGLADADLGTLMTRAAAIQGGTMPSWSATTNVSVRLTTVTANTNQLTTGSTTYYLVTETYP